MKKSYLKYTDKIKLMILMVLTVSCLNIINETKAGGFPIENLISESAGIDLLGCYLSKIFSNTNDGKSWSECIKDISEMTSNISNLSPEYSKLIALLEETKDYTSEIAILTKFADAKSFIPKNSDLEKKLTVILAAHFIWKTKLPTPRLIKNLRLRIKWNSLKKS